MDWKNAFCDRAGLVEAQSIRIAEFLMTLSVKFFRNGN